ncbi:MAG: anaerobic ribonucleoside-triphosphate reductase activating protein [Firmicutes bacterium]|jgi:anaerobic ribonucleoside-triphosphate reductase activating protein|nr:anaerobic ribonucleoside-triphosphate reductase activating protein [Bacillota bacterium]
MQLRIAGLHRQSVVDGPGVRTVVFTQGCHHSCPGCHNPQTHDPQGGRLVDINELAAEILSDKHVRGVTFSGGEPFLQPRALAALAGLLKSHQIHLVVYSGYTFEELLEKGRQDQATAALLAACDLLVDGPYLQEQRDISLLYRGSRNQRIIDLPASLKAGEAVLSELHFRGLRRADA